MSIRTDEALESIAVALKYLGNGDAGTSMGAIEGFGFKLKKYLEPTLCEHSAALNEVACGLLEIAAAIREHTGATLSP